MQIRLYPAGWLATFAALSITSLAGAQQASPPPDAETESAAAPVDDSSAPDDGSDTQSSTATEGDSKPNDDAPSQAAPKTQAAGASTADAEVADVGRGDDKKGDQQEDDKKKGKKKPWEKDPKTKIRGLLRALWLLQDADAVPVHQFRVESARLELSWKHAGLLDATVEFDAAQEPGEPAWSVLRDAYVRVKPLRELKLRGGQFKKPFSRLELRGRRKLRLVDRGISNEWIVEDLGYGGRDIGLQVEGRFGKETSLSYQVGVFNGSGSNTLESDLDGSKDVAGRLELDHSKWLSVGVSGSHQRFDQDVTPQLPRSGTMGEADIRLRIGRFRALAEGMFGENQLSIDHAESWSALLLASYKIPLTTTWRMALEPVAKVEILKIEHHVRDAHIWAATAGANYHLGQYFRLMLQGEWTRPSANTLDLWVESHRLLIQAIVDLR